MAARPIIRVGDRTSHGGTVMQGFPFYTIEGRSAAGLRHMVSCPQCNGAFPIVEGVSTFAIDDGFVAIEGMKTSCGATLIASQSFAVVDPGPGGIVRAAGDSSALAKGLLGGGDEPDQQLENSLHQTDCDHTDTAVPLAEYIVREMKTNPFSIRGRQIYDANYYDTTAYYQERENAPWYTKLSGQKTYIEKKAVQKLWAYTLFADIIGPNRPWDHKPHFIATLKAKGIFNSGWQKYGEFDYYFDIWSNIHYGYVGVALGFSTAELINSAGLAQALLDSYNALADMRWPTMQDHPANGSWPASADDVPDHISIKLGCDLYTQAQPHQLTAAMLLQTIEAVPLPWGVGGDKAKEFHKCNR